MSEAPKILLVHQLNGNGGGKLDHGSGGIGPLRAE